MVMVCRCITDMLWSSKISLSGKFHDLLWRIVQATLCLDRAETATLSLSNVSV